MSEGRVRDRHRGQIRPGDRGGGSGALAADVPGRAYWNIMNHRETSLQGSDEAGGEGPRGFEAGCVPGAAGGGRGVDTNGKLKNG